MSKEDELKAKGIDEILVYCVNDAAVMEAWSDKMNVKPKSLVTMLADPGCKFTEAMGLAMPADEVPPQLGYVRSKRYAAVFNEALRRRLQRRHARAALRELRQGRPRRRRRPERVARGERPPEALSASPRPRRR